MARAIIVGCLTWLASSQPSAAEPQKVDSPHLPNAYRLNDRVLSGGEPAGEAAFAGLRELGIKTIISVDGAQPDVALARKFGLQYVHLPHGYDGIPDERLMQLAKAVRDLPGPVYIHCHHGKHRSPAAAAGVCVLLGTLSRDEALGLLKTAGTSPNYRGLYQTVSSARKLDGTALDHVKVEFREKVDVPPIAEAMVAIEHAHDALDTMAATGWKPPADDPDREPAHEALLLKEHLVELSRTEEVKRRPQPFARMMHEAERAAADLEATLRDASAQPQRRVAAFERVTSDCKQCHQRFRDVPLGEKKKLQPQPH